ncbi:hypothetical protein VaNZ11_014943 [Volvox africanus]|uniref:Uncharacterized protein n=1 Tax=Volvox africanus TaxID=51714 RepID=A0ABQ5SJR3_9CHLO|nr:hypothetical protein VaNZ11_014943 [Volvox africanus]
MRCLNPEKLRLFASPCIAVSLLSRRALRTCLLATATPNSSILATGSGRPEADGDGGIRFVYEPPRRFVLAALRKRRHSPPNSAKPRIDLLVEGNPLSTSPLGQRLACSAATRFHPSTISNSLCVYGALNCSARVEPLAGAVRSDAAAALQVVLQRRALNSPGWKMPRIALLSLVLCDDPHIRDLNSRHRGRDSATDVLSFEMEDDLDYRVHLPLKLMGDLVVSLDTAERQAAEHGHSLLDECRILLVHGLLHLAGYDHERGREAHEAMAEEERAVLAELKWQGKGLIAAAEEGSEEQRGIDNPGDDEGAVGSLGREGQGRQGQGEGKAAARRSGGGITAGAGAGFLWQEMAREGGSGKGAAEEKAASRDPRAEERRREKEGASGSAAEVRGPDSGQQTPWSSPSPSSSLRQQGREGGRGSAGGGGGGRGARALHGAKGGQGARRAFNMDSSVGLAGPAASSGSASLYGPGSSVPPIPYIGASRSQLLVSPRGTSGGRWLHADGGRYASSVVRCYCRAGGDDGDGGAGSSVSLTAAAAATAAVAAASNGSADAKRASDGADGDGVTSTSAAATAAGGTASAAFVATAGYGTQRPRHRTREVAIVALDLDGTLLDSRSRILPSSAAAIRAAADAGVIVVAATGKARPAALAAAASAGLAEPGLLVWPQGPGVFLQGLAVHGRGGAALSDAALPHSVVEAAYKYSAASGVALCVFLGDTCATPDLTAEIRELHTTYYEPLAEVVPSAASLRTGPPVRKMLFMTDPGTVTNELLPYWTRQLEGSEAQVMQAVPNMLEIVPSGVNKWAGVRRLLNHLGLPPSALMAVGDGGNDLEMVAGAGLGVAMGNAVPAVRAAAAAVVAGHDDGGVAEAFERFVL